MSYGEISNRLKLYNRMSLFERYVHIYSIMWRLYLVHGRQRPISQIAHCFQQTREWGVPLILAGYPKSMIEIYLLCQTHAYLDLATLSSDKDFYGFRSCQNEGRVACGLAIRIFIASVTAFRVAK